MNDLSGSVQAGILGLLGTIIAVLFTWRGVNKVKNDNAKANRDSRFEENLQKRYEEAMTQNSELRAELREAREGHTLLKRELRDQTKRVRNLLELLEPQARQSVQRWVEESGFAPFEEEPRKPRR